ncbi:MAG: large conductance mechanosensitive channel protein MscL [Chloroflexota bacterium]
MFKEFKEFAMKGNMLDMAVGIVLGAGFAGLVNSLVNDILLPVVGLLLGNADFSNLFVVLQAGTPGAPYDTLAASQAAGAVTLNYGVFVSALVNFAIIAFALFLIVRMVNRLRGDEAAEEKTE